MAEIKLPTEKEIVDYLDQNTELDPYRDRIESTWAYTGMGWAGPIFLLNSSIFHSIRQHRKSYRIAGLIGENLRIVDDFLDGDGVEQIQDRERFLSNYIETVETGKKDHDMKDPTEEIAYEAGHLFYRLLKQDEEIKDDVVSRLERMKSLVKEEDKSSETGYRDYIEAAGSEYGRVLMKSFELIDGVEVSEEEIEFAADYGQATQVADDRFDGDVELEERKLKRIYDESLEQLFQNSGFVPKTIGFMGRKVPSIYPWMMRTHETLDRHLDSSV